VDYGTLPRQQEETPLSNNKKYKQEGMADGPNLFKVTAM
jgi:hypothetical protein